MSKVNKILNFFVITLLLFMVIKGMLNGQKPVADTLQPKYDFVFTFDDAEQHYGDVDSIVLDGIASYSIMKDNNIIGNVVNTSPFSDDIYGYNGITPLTIYLDENDKIFEVELCENRETRGYMNKVINSGYLDLWDGLTPNEAANHNVDAVSGCTFTSISIAESLQIRMQELSKQKKLHSLDWKLLSRQICVLIVTVLALICFFNPKKTKKLRGITLLLSIAILGFWTNSLLSLALFYNWITNGISVAIQLPLLIIAVLSIIFPLFLKKSFYCQYLCPFGAIQEFVGIIPVRKRNVTAKVFKVMTILRKVVLLILLLLAVMGIGLDLSVVEPFPIFNYQSIGFGIAVFVAVILVAAIFFRKPWCNYLCPTGTLLDIFRRRNDKNS